ncbi:MAG: hypothetical protein ACOCZ6_04220, partial [Nanoarchaeota archaeon]
MAVNKERETFKGFVYSPEGQFLAYNLKQEDAYRRFISNPELEVLADKRAGEISTGNATLSYIVETQPMNHFAALHIKDGLQNASHYFNNGCYEGTQIYQPSKNILENFATAKPWQIGLNENPTFQQSKNTICGVAMDFSLPDNVKDELRQAPYDEVDLVLGQYL